MHHLFRSFSGAMMKPSRLLSLVLLVLFTFATSSAMGRTWTDKFGESIKAKFIRFHDGKVVLKRGNKVITIPFDELSEEDQDFVREELEKKGQVDLLPPKVAPDAFDGNASGGIDIEPDEERTWTDVKGREIRAKMLRLTDDGVVLLYKGREVTVPLERLIPADREYAKDRAAKRRIAKQSPPPVQQAPNPHFAQPPRHSPSPRQPRQIPKYEPPKYEPTPMPKGLVD